MNDLFQKIRNGSKVLYPELKEEFLPLFPMLGDISDTPQDPVWHAEGNVEIHTANVIEDIYNQLDENSLEGENRLICVLAALFHDIAKPISTRERQGKDRIEIIAPRHAEKGRSYLAYKALSLGLPYPTLRKVLNLVGLHHEPKWMVMDSQNKASYEFLSRKVPLQLLYVLEMADIVGRSCADQDQQIEHIQMFRLFCEEYGVYELDADPLHRWFDVVRSSMGNPEKITYIERATTQGFIDYQKGSIYTPEEAGARGMANGIEFPEVVLTCGPSGSGKSSWIQNHLPEYDIVSMDHIREELTGNRADQSQNGQVLQEAKERLKVSLRKNGKVVWDATNLRKDFRNLPIRIASDYGAHTSMVIFHMKEEVFFAQNRDRDHSIPEPILRKQLDNVQFPYIDETHRTLFIGEEGHTLFDTRSIFLK